MNIICPELKPGHKRISDLKENISSWVYSDTIHGIIDMYGYRYEDIIKQVSLTEDILTLSEFASKELDYRKKRYQGGERWLIAGDDFISKNEDKIMRFSKELGLIGKVIPDEKDPDFVLVLGGARWQGLYRPMMAKKLIDEYNMHLVVVGLTGLRELSELDYTAVNDYAPEAKTEYEATISGIIKAFGISDNYKEERHDNENINLSSAFLRFDDSYKENELFCMASASPDPDRRANSFDTFHDFMNCGHFEVKEGSKILMITTQIYVPFQLAKFIPIAIEHNLYVEAVGVSDDISYGGLSNAGNYLQETKAAIDAIKIISDKYFK